MKRKKARHLIMELARRIYFDTYGTYKGFGKRAKHYRDDYRQKDHILTGGYKKAWNHELIIELRKKYGM